MAIMIRSKQIQKVIHCNGGIWHGYWHLKCPKSDTLKCAIWCGILSSTNWASRKRGTPSFGYGGRDLMGTWVDETMRLYCKMRDGCRREIILKDF